MDTETQKLKGLFWRLEYYGAITEGGMASMYYGLLNGFLKLGNSAVFTSSGRMSLPPDVKYYFIKHNNLLKNLPEILNLPYNRKAINKVKKIIENEGIDFIYQHHHDFIYAGSIIKRDLGLPFMLHCDGVQQWVKANWGKLYFKHLLKWTEEIQWENADAIFTISENVKSMMIDYGVDASKVYVNPNSVDPEVFNPEISGDNIRNKYNITEKFVVGFTGSFGQWHGVEVLADAIKLLKKLIPDVFVLFVGDGLLRPRIEQTIKDDDVSDIALITGMVPFSIIPEFLSACDVLVTPTVNNEDDSEMFGSPTKLFEYLAMAKPIVASSVGQLKEVIQNNYNGILINQRSPEELAEAVKMLYDDKDLRDKIGLNARKSAIEKYNWKFNAQKIIDVYNKIKNN